MSDRQRFEYRVTVVGGRTWHRVYQTRHGALRFARWKRDDWDVERIDIERREVGPWAADTGRVTW